MENKNYKNYTIEEIKCLINKGINNEEIKEEDEICYEEAEKIIKKQLKNDSNNKELLFLLGLVQYGIYSSSGDEEKSIETFKKLLRLDYEKDKVLYYLAVLYYYNKPNSKILIKKNIKLLESAIELNDKDSEYWYLLGRMYFYHIKDYDKSIFCYTKAAKINYTEIMYNEKKYYHYQLGKINLYVGSSIDAAENLKKAINSFDYSYNLSDAWYYLGLSYEKNNQYDEAVKSYENALYINADSRLDDYFYGSLYTVKSLYDLYKKLGKNYEAVYALENSIEKDAYIPFYFIPFPNRKEEYENFKGSEIYNDIVKAYTNVIKNNSYNAKGYISHFSHFYELYKEYDKAIELHNKISKESYENIAGIYEKTKNYDKAIDIYKMLINMYPDNSACFFNYIASVYRKTKNYEKSINYYKKALEADSKNTDYYINIAETYEKIKNYEEAANYYNKTIELYNGPCRYYEKLAEAYKNIGKYEKAIEAYKEYLKIVNNGHEVSYLYTVCFKLNTLKNIAHLYDKLNDIENRNLYYEKAIERCGELIKEYKYYKKMYLEEMADIYMRIGCKEEAFEIYHDLIKKYDKEILKNKKDYELLEKQGELYGKIDNKEKAFEIYSKAIGLCLKKIERFKNTKISYTDEEYEDKISFCMEDLSYLALFYQKVSRYEEANLAYEELIKIYEEKVTDSEDSIFYLESIAEIYIKLNNSDNALKTYKRILEIDKYNDAEDKIRYIQSGNKIRTAHIFELSHRIYMQHGQTEMVSKKFCN